MFDDVSLNAHLDFVIEEMSNADGKEQASAIGITLLSESNSFNFPVVLASKPTSHSSRFSIYWLINDTTSNLLSVELIANNGDIIIRKKVHLNR